jgi:hypothetical protein
MKKSPQIELLLLNKKVCRDIAKSYDSLMLILNQNMRDVVTETNMPIIGPAVLAHKEIVDVIDLFDGAGRKVLAEEEKAEKLKNKQ